MSHGTISSTQIDLNSPDYASAKNNPYIAGLLSAGWRWGSAGHTDGSEEQTIHYFLEGSNWDPESAPNQDLYVHSAMLTWSSVANIHFTQVFHIDEAEIVILMLPPQLSATMPAILEPLTKRSMKTRTRL